MQNIEFKAELRDTALARVLCNSIQAAPVATLEQTDTYFRIPDAKLKRRECVGYEPEWILYFRQSSVGPKLSRFTIYSELQAQHRFGSSPLPKLCVIRKRRELFMSRSGIRIHLDHVDGLGAFIEFEALICPERSIGDCSTQIDELLQVFQPVMGEPISAGYSDMVLTDLTISN